MIRSVRSSPVYHAYGRSSFRYLFSASSKWTEEGADELGRHDINQVMMRYTVMICMEIISRGSFYFLEKISLKMSLHSFRLTMQLWNRVSTFSSIETPLCNRPTGTRPTGLFSPTQWKFKLPSTQRIFSFYPAIFMLPQ